MNYSLFFCICGVLILLFLFLNFIFLFLINKNIKKKNKYSKSDFNESEYVVLNHILIDIIEKYKISKLNSKLVILRKQYDLNDKSETNSIKQYNEKLNEIYSLCCMDIYKKYLTSQFINTILKYKTEDALLVEIITKLKETE